MILVFKSIAGAHAFLGQKILQIFFEEMQQGNEAQQTSLCFRRQGHSTLTFSTGIRLEFAVRVYR